MADNQFAVYQLREIPENRKKRFRSYAELKKEHIQIRYTDYKQVYRSWMRYDETPDNIRNCLATRISVLDRLHLKQAALNMKNLPQPVMENEMERKRK